MFVYSSSFQAFWSQDPFIYQKAFVYVSYVYQYFSYKIKTKKILKYSFIYLKLTMINYYMLTQITFLMREKIFQNKTIYWESTVLHFSKSL